jgi:hypothetical protein
MSPDDDPRREAFWRIYLYAHLMVVVLTGAASFCETVNLQHDLGGALFAVAGVFSIALPLAPFVSLGLLLLALARGRRYFILGLADGLLSLGHFLAVLPAVQ